MGQNSRIRIVFLFLIQFFLLVSASAPAWAERPFPKPKGLVNDFANVLSPSYERKISAAVAELLRKTKTAVVVATMPDIGGAEYNDYANRLYSAWGIGKKGEDRGVLIFITVKERKMRIETGYGVEGILPDGLVGEIRDSYMLPYLKENRFEEALLNGTLALIQVISRDAGVKMTGQMPTRIVKKSRSGLSLLPIILIFIIFMFASRRRGGFWPFLLLLLIGTGGGRYGSGGMGGSFGGFGGGFGGFGGGMSGGGGAGGSF